MIIKLDKSLNPYLDNELLSDNEIEALAEIALSRKRGESFVIADKKLIIKLINYPGFASYTKANFTQVYKDQSRWFNYLNEFTNKLIIVKSLIEKSDDENIVTELKSFERNKAIVVAENIYDINFFEILTKSFLSSSGLKHINFNFNRVLGGGNTTAQVVAENSKKTGVPILVILDSDKKYPGGDIGGTAKKVLELGVTKNVNVVLTASREIENIIPFILLEDLFEKNKGQTDKLQKYKKICDLKVDGANPVKYLDFKKGIKLSHATKENCDNTNKFWSEVLMALGYKNLNCDCETIKKCTCFVLDGFGSDLLKSAVNYFEGKIVDYDKIENEYTEEISYICKQMSSYVLAPQRLVS